MKKVFVAFKIIEQENQSSRESIVHLQTNWASTSLGCIPKAQPQPKGPQIDLPYKFDGTCSKFRSFVNQVRLVHSYDILGAGMLWKPKDLHKIR
jgi:hypothetical protein